MLLPWWAIPALHAEAPAEAQGVVSRVEIVGFRRVEVAVFEDAVRTRVGDRLDADAVARDVRAIWATGFVDDVRGEVDPDPAGGVVLRYVVKEKPAVREVRIVGAKKIKEEDVKEAVDIEAWTVPSASRVQSNVKAIRDKYLEKGFYLADVKAELKPVDDVSVDLVFDITENRKVIVQKVDITGNDHVPDRKFRRYMQTRPGGILPWLTNSGTFIEANLDTDADAIQYVLLQEGYVDAKVDEPKVYLSPDKRYIYVSIHVEEGQRYRVGRVTIEGDVVPEEGLTVGAMQALIDGHAVKEVQEAFERDQKAGVVMTEAWSPKLPNNPLDFSLAPATRTGDWFKLQTVQDAALRIRELYGDQGYALVEAAPNPVPDPDSATCDVVFTVQRGEKMRIGRINITGNIPTHDKVVRREIPINEQEIYRGSAIREAKQRLERLGFFETVETVTPLSGPGTMDLNVAVTERPTGSFSVGAGYGSADSFIFTANVQKANFLGLGYLMSLNASISSRSKQANVSFYDPHLLDSQWTLRVDGFYNERNYIEREYQRGGALEVGRYLDRRDDVRMALEYQLEDVGLLSLDDYKARLFGGELYRNGLTSSVGISLDVDKRNNRINATRGWKSSLKTELAGGLRLDDDTTLSLLGGDFNFWQTQFNFRFYQPLVKKGDWLVFKYNGSLGYIESTDGTIIPYIHRYRAGGILSVRGYSPYSLGPSIRAAGYTRDQRFYSFYGTDDPTNAEDKLVVGGTQTWVNNFELESPVVKAAGISLVAFLDAGNTFGDPWGEGMINPLELRWAYGAGVRWFSPIGPLRFEWGFPINREPDERAAVFDFTIGSAF